MSWPLSFLITAIVIQSHSIDSLPFTPFTILLPCMSRIARISAPIKKCTSAGSVNDLSRHARHGHEAGDYAFSNFKKHLRRKWE